jgi:tetratricopeptide (TPR) repeat protein
MPVDEHPGCAELVDLAEASLALGDAEAALQLLDQVKDSYRDNRWLVAQVEALRIHGDHEECQQLATTSLERMIDQADWVHARRILVESGRVFNELAQDRKCIEFLHPFGFKLRSLDKVDPLFHVQIVAILASRIAGEGDADTASQLLSTVDSIVDSVGDRRARASILWVQSEIAEHFADVDHACELIEQVLLIYSEEDDPLAVAQVVIRLSHIVTSYKGVSDVKLRKAQEWVARVLTMQLGDGHSEIELEMLLRSAELDHLLGDTASAIEALEDVRQRYRLTGLQLAQYELIFALSALKAGQHGATFLHLEASLSILEPFAGDEWINGRLRTIAHVYAELGESSMASALLSKALPPEGDLSWCLDSFQWE